VVWGGVPGQVYRLTMVSVRNMGPPMGLRDLYWPRYAGKKGRRREDPWASETSLGHVMPGQGEGEEEGHGPLGTSLGHVITGKGGPGPQGTSLGHVMTGRGREEEGDLSWPRCGRGEEKEEGGPLFWPRYGRKGEGRRRTSLLLFS